MPMNRLFSLILLLILALTASPAQAVPPLVRESDTLDFSAGLQGSHIALWQSHGFYFEKKLNRWEWQRARIFQTVEDLYTQGYVLPFLSPMLRNAGAYVLSPRERDTSVHELIIDGDGGFAQGEYREKRGKSKWYDSPSPGFAYSTETLRDGDNPFLKGKARLAAAVPPGVKPSVAQWFARVPATGEYAVYVSYASLPESADDARYTVNTAAGPRTFHVNQRMSGGTWVYLGHFPFSPSADPRKPLVELSNVSSRKGAVVSADAVKIGGGMGNVERPMVDPSDSTRLHYLTGGRPRFTEGARYWLQWAGMPDSVYSPSGFTNDYSDDYRCRALWVNYMAGGSAALPHERGLAVPIDLSLGFHTDAGTTPDDSIIGTLGIYCTKGDTLGDGSSRSLSARFTDLVMTEIVDDIRRLYEPRWTRRDMWDKSYHEARAPMVPAMLLELLSHQNFADMKYGLDPGFRFAVSRSIYKGVLRFIAERDGRPYVVQPLPVADMAIMPEGEGEFRLSWRAVADSLEPSAMPGRYIVEERIGSRGAAFRRIAVVEDTALILRPADDRLRSYRVIACNAGGRSFPSETLALRYAEGAPVVMVVNGFTRVSAPDTFDAGDIAGFYDARDGGVPYIEDISYIGPQFEFRRRIPWMDDDAAGFGASRSVYEDMVIAGNTFDYPALHGDAIARAGCTVVSASRGAFEKSMPAGGFAAVDLILGKQKETTTGRGARPSRFKAFTPAMQQALRRWTSAGCNVLVSGSYIASDLRDNPHTAADTALVEADCAFAADVLGYRWRVGQAAVEGRVHPVLPAFGGFGDDTGFSFVTAKNSEMYCVESPDAIVPADSRGATALRYSENNLPAAVAFDSGAYRVVAMGFPFETIEGDSSRDLLMEYILKYLLK